MTSLIALTLSIGILAGVATWLYLIPLAVLSFQIWQGFISWASYFHCGGGVDGAKNTVICMSFGAIVGAAVIALAGQLGGLGEFAAPVSVAIGAAVLVLGSSHSLLAVIPASVYGFAAVAGLILLKGIAPVDALVPTIGSIILGAAFGFASEKLAGVLTSTTEAEA